MVGAFNAFNDLLQTVGQDIDDPGFSAVRRFLQSWECARTEETIAPYQAWEDVCSANLIFRLDGARGFIHDREAVQREWIKYGQRNTDAPLGQCLITGATDTPLARVHTPIKGVRGGQTSGGYIVSFNASAFVSYNQDKASVVETSAFAYTTALNSLLSGSSRQKITIGDATYVFWAACCNPLENIFAFLIDPSCGRGTNTYFTRRSADHQRDSRTPQCDQGG